MKKIPLILLCLLLLFAFSGCGGSAAPDVTDPETMPAENPVADIDSATILVKDLVGTGDGKYSFDFSNEDRILKNSDGSCYVNREEDGKGQECFVIRVFIETKAGDSVNQENIGWYFVTKDGGKVYEMLDPYEIQLRAMN